VSPDERRYHAGAVVEAIAVYRRLLGQLDPSGKFANYSKFQEWTEGAALYTEYRMTEAAAAPGYQPTPAFLRLPGAHDYRRLWKQTYQGKVFRAKHAGRAARSRTAFYHLGLAKCLLLERLAPDRKERYFAAGTWLDDLLGDAVREP
jgi:hypothetical protein